jgi:hypothetical protein
VLHAVQFEIAPHYASNEVMQQEGCMSYASKTG